MTSSNEKNTGSHGDDRIIKVELDVEVLKEEQRDFREQLKEMFKQHHLDITDIAINHNKEIVKLNQDIKEVQQIQAVQAERHNLEFERMNNALETTNESFSKLTGTFDKWGQRAFGAIVAFLAIYLFMSGDIGSFLAGLVR